MHQETTTQNLVSLAQNHLIAQLRNLTSKMAPSQKIEVAQVLLYQVSKTCKSPLKLLVPKGGANEEILAAFGIAQFLSTQMLLDLTIEILETSKDKNG